MSTKQKSHLQIQILDWADEAYFQRHLTKGNDLQPFWWVFTERQQGISPCIRKQSVMIAGKKFGGENETSLCRIDEWLHGSGSTDIYLKMDTSLLIGMSLLPAF